MNCIECFMRDGHSAPAEFIINGQSMCQKHVHRAARAQDEKPPTYTWSLGHNEPTLAW